MEHSKALAKIKKIYKAENNDMDATKKYITRSSVFREWHGNDFGLVVRTTGTEYEGIILGDKECPNMQLFKG